MTVKEAAAKYGEYIISMRREFHENPEPSMKEIRTSKRIREELDKIGVPWVVCGGETGTLATIKGAKPGKTILIRGDIDALSVKEETGLPFVSKVDGMMHACGHDGHASMLLTAAHMLNDMKDELCGTVKLAFQPGEETAQGAVAMINDGALDGVDGCFGIHLWADVPSGKFNIEEGPRMASADMFVIDVTGKGGHGSMPHQCVDAAIVSSAIVSNLQTIVSREFDPLDPAVVTVGKMEVGTRWNVVPGYGKIEGTTRCFSKNIWDQFDKVMDRIVTETAKTFRAEAKLTYTRLVEPTINDPAVAESAYSSALKIFGEDGFSPLEKTTGGEDFAAFINRVPGAIALVGCANEAKGCHGPHHSGGFNIDEDALIKGASLYAQVAVDFTSKN